MSVAQPATHRSPGRLPSSFRAFGIDVVGGSADRIAAATTDEDRTVVIEYRSAEEIDRAWHRRAAVTVLERRRGDGSLVMVVDHHPEIGYRVYAPRNGRHLVSPDGRQVVSALPPIAPWRWQRLLFAQVLPLAATLQGLELLHASAVEWHGRTVGFVARAGTGKTSTAAHVVAAGGTLLTDDVLALEQIERSIFGHSGAPALSIDADELLRMTPGGRSRLGVPLGTVDKVVLSAHVTPRTSRLDGLYFLERRRADGLHIDPVDADPVLLLANSFNIYVRTPERIVNQLGVAGRLAETVPVFKVCIPPGVPAAEVARAVVAHVESR